MNPSQPDKLMQNSVVSQGLVIVGLDGVTLTADEKHLLQNPLVGGVLLLGRNYLHRQQLALLLSDIRRQQHNLIVAVDHESAHAQRFRREFPRLPDPADIGRLYQEDVQMAQWMAYAFGQVVVTDIHSVGLDLTFAPVLDLRNNHNFVVRTRAFHRREYAVAVLGKAMIQGMHSCGGISVGKHFPGHGSVAEDTHREAAVDRRTLSTIRKRDLYPFVSLLQEGLLDSLMFSHVVHSMVDSTPACLSRFWHSYVRREIGFDGMIFSDDLCMRGCQATVESVWKILKNGCDMVIFSQKCTLLYELLQVADSQESVAGVLCKRLADKWRRIRCKAAERHATVAENGRLMDVPQAYRSIMELVREHLPAQVRQQ